MYLTKFYQYISQLNDFLVDFCDLSGKVVTKNNINYDKLNFHILGIVLHIPFYIVY